ncbi:MAG TPA: hypothetical protein VK540_16620 [Polyangiaceae bacterium]|nr:hypothetical protein [Polyangiaceae bacterium]
MTQSPLLGFNNNVKHRGRLFHIQTEDSGVRHPHVITHLFMDGGRILKTVKTSYAEHVGSDKVGHVVRDLMKEQHKMMFIALRDGQFDHVLDSVPPPSMSGPPVHPVVPSARSPSGALPALRQAAPADSAVAAPPPASTTRPLSPPSSAAMRAAPGAEGGGPSTGVRPVPRREAPELFGAQTAEAAVVNVVAEPAAAAAGGANEGKTKEQPGSGRYAASRPAAVFASGRNADAGGSIFGDDLISEKSLDEVILSYLSDDLDSTSSKK